MEEKKEGNQEGRRESCLCELRDGNDREDGDLKDVKWKMGVSVETTTVWTGTEDPRPVLESGER